ncbi:MAG TPA: hypothetical protein VFF51_02885 [Candidatus Methylomirabilis sp.]|nr:hypothetical protein [Candidatus Methylomirabilis sp.]
MSRHNTLTRRLMRRMFQPVFRAARSLVSRAAAGPRIARAAS